MIMVEISKLKYLKSKYCPKVKAMPPMLALPSDAIPAPYKYLQIVP